MYICDILLYLQKYGYFLFVINLITQKNEQKRDKIKVLRNYI